MLIEGYDDGPLVAGEPLLTRPGFWSNHLLAVCGDGTCAERPDPEWFGDDGADCDALSDVLFDPDRWPVFRVPVDDEPGAVVIYRNLDGDYGTDYLHTPPEGDSVRQIVRWEREFPRAGLTWHELVSIADNPSATAVGVREPEARLLLVLPLLDDLELPAAASVRITAALTAVGAPRHSASVAAGHLLAHLAERSRHDPTWGSPLSGS